MKISESKLRKIIKEEVRSLISENYLKKYIVEPSAHKELQQTLDSSDYEKLSKLFKYWDEKVDTSNMVDDREFNQLDFYFPIDTADDFLKYAEAYAEMLDVSKMRQGAKNIRQILRKYR